MKKTYIKPQINVESLLAGDFCAAGCNPDYIYFIKNNVLSDGGCSKSYIEGGRFEIIENDPDESVYCYHSGGYKILMS